MRHIGETLDHKLSANRVPLAGDQVPLMMLSAQFEGNSMKALATIIKKDKAGILRGLRSLEKRGLIRFQGEVTDKRKRLVYLTPTGHDLMGKIMIYVDEVGKQIINGITPAEIRGFYETLDKINTNCLKCLGKEGQTLDDFEEQMIINSKMTKDR
jgi:DNA-binding MarR family transcriptional regulator